MKKLNISLLFGVLLGFNAICVAEDSQISERELCEDDAKQMGITDTQELHDFIADCLRELSSSNEEDSESMTEENSSDL